MKVNIAGVDEYTEPTRILVAGQANVEKMQFAATAPQPLWLSANADRSTLARLGLAYTEIESLDDLFNMKVALDRSPEERKALLGIDVSTIVFDSVDELQRVLLEEHIQKEGRSETKIEDWGWIGRKLNAIFAAFGKLDLNIIVLAGIKDIPVSESETWIKPAIQGAFADQIHRYMTYSVLLRSSTTDVPDLEAQGTTPNIQKMGDYEVVLTNADGNAHSATWLVTKPVSYAEWIFDSSSRLPFRLTLEFENDYLNLLSYRADVDLQESKSKEIDPRELILPSSDTAPEATETNDSDGSTEEGTPTTETQTGNPVCADCGGAIESNNWILLAEMQGWPPVCKQHFSARKNSK